MGMIEIWPIKLLNRNFVRFRLPAKSHSVRFRLNSLTYLEYVFIYLSKYRSTYDTLLALLQQKIFLAMVVPRYYQCVRSLKNSVTEPPPPEITMADHDSPAPAGEPCSLADHKLRISHAASLLDPSERDTALISALRGVTAELESAEEAHFKATERLETAKELFDWATGALSGYSKTKNNGVVPMGQSQGQRGRKRRGEGDGGFNDDQAERMKFTNPVEGPLSLPPPASGGGMTDAQIAEHKDAFYMKLCGVPYSELGAFAPPATLANLKTRAQLEENIHIATHWDTGTDTLSVMDFRRQHKVFYTKMKNIKENIGRRTGHHVRDVIGSDGRKAFCQSGKNDESLLYISMEELYDAIFEVHCLMGHRGWNATKNIVNFKYANIPLEQVRFFIETCPACLSKRTGRRTDA